MLAIPSRVIAACFGLLGFAAALVVGTVADNPATLIIGWGLVTMVVGWCVGLVIGTITQRTIDDHIAEFKQQHPIPDEGVSSVTGGGTALNKAG